MIKLTKEEEQELGKWWDERTSAGPNGYRYLPDVFKLLWLESRRLREQAIDLEKENKIYRGNQTADEGTISALTLEITSLREQVRELQSLGVHQHSDPKDCPVWYDGCHCFEKQILSLREKLDKAYEAIRQSWFMTPTDSAVCLFCQKFGLTSRYVQHKSDCIVLEAQQWTEKK